MHPVVAYLLKMLLCSAVLLGYYWLALRNERFHQWNRFYLLAAMLLSVVVPLASIPLLAPQEPTAVVTMVAALPWNQVAMPAETGFAWGAKQWLLLAAGLVSMALLLHLALTLARLFRLYRTHPHTWFREVSVVVTDTQAAPFSFFKWLFWRGDIDPDTPNGQRMLQHELAHIGQKHSYDKLFAELLLVAFWMNPFFWIIRRELYAIHEFLADQKAIESHDGAAFAAMILQATHPGLTPALVNPFFTSHLKRRLMMITTSHQPKYSYLRRISGLVMMTAIGLSIMLTVEKVQAQQAPSPPAKKSAPAPPAPAEAPSKPAAVSPPALPDSIVTADVVDKNGVCHVVYRMKDGRTVKLKLNDAKAKGYPVPDAPPPPPAPAPAAKPAAGAPAPAPPPPPTEVKVVQGYNLADIKPEDHPLYVYGGLIITPEQAMQIEPGRIGEVHVIKSDDAIKRYGEKAKNGAVLIEPKNTSYEEFSRVGRNPETGVVTVQGKPLNGQPKEVVVTGYAKPNTGNTNVVERPINISDIAGKQPLLMLEGKEINKAELDKLDPGNIESINVLKGENAIAKYGQKGENGVIEIVMKAKPKQEAKKQ